MKALVLKKPGEFAYEDRPMPACASGELLIRVDAVCICGSDNHAIRGGHAMFSYPRVIGHEVAGTVHQVGDGVSGFRPGDKVCLMPCIPCGTCRACQKGKTNACKTLKLFGVHTGGGLQEYFAAPAANFLKVPASALPEEIAMLEPLTIGAHAVAKLDLQLMDRVLVIGAGPIGVSCAVNAKTYGASVTMADTSPHRREFVEKQFGLTCLDPLASDYADQINDITNSDLFDAVIDTTAVKISMENSWKWITNGGKIVFVGICSGTLELDGKSFHAREPSLYVTRNATLSDFQRVVSLWQEKELDPRQFVTHTAPFPQAASEILRWMYPEAGVFKGIVTFP